MGRISTLISATLLAAASGSAWAQFNPGAGQWGKTDPTDLRVMTYNIQDALCSTSTTNNSPTTSATDWQALARIIAALKPDVLILQEAGDNDGNGTGGSSDSQATLATVVELFMHGGADPFAGGSPITTYVQLYAPGYDLPYVFVSALSDNFNRNIILSRYPFSDLNGDAVSQKSNLDLILADQYAPGGQGGIRGFMFAEIDLPDATYAGNLVVGCGHLKSGGNAQDHTDRVNAARNIAYYIDYLFNGAGTGVPDPNNKIINAVTSILGPDDFVVWGGDLNEDELNNGTKGPAEWTVAASLLGGTDGTDRNRTDSMYDDARDPFNSSRVTQGSSSKLDYLCWQDSIGTMRHQFIFNSSTASGAGAIPTELIGFPITPSLATSFAADHRPVIVDFILPPASIDPPGSFTLTSPADNARDVSNTPTLTWSASTGADTYDVTIATDAGLTSVVHAASGVAATTYNVPGAVLSECNIYYWGVEAVNGAGSTASTPLSHRLDTLNIADFNNDGNVSSDDFIAYLSAYGNGDMSADIDGNPGISTDDFIFYLGRYAAGC